MTTGSAIVVRADARTLPLRDDTVDLIVTSPPYYALRSYQDGGEHYAGQIGSEATPQEYINSLLACTREWMRVLKPSGSIFVNLGDKYASSSSGRLGVTGSKTAYARLGYRDTSSAARPKSLIGLPWRYAIGCVDELGLILRAEVIWSKVNGLPESVTDRVRRSHEQWFHLVKQPQYFSAVDELRQPYAAKTFTVATSPRRSDHGSAGDRRNKWHADNDVSRSDMIHPLGALPGSVWDIPSQPLTVPAHLGVNHFAAFPVEWPRCIILGWSPSGICVSCGEGREPHHVATRYRGGTPVTGGLYGAGGKMGTATGRAHTERTRRIPAGTGCRCPSATAPTRPAIVLDPFGGTGTTALAAKALGRHGISVDMSADYCRIARWRTSDPAELAKALRLPKPPTEAEGQSDLLDLLDQSTESR